MRDIDTIMMIFLMGMDPTVGIAIAFVAAFYLGVALRWLYDRLR